MEKYTDNGKMRRELYTVLAAYCLKQMSNTKTLEAKVNGMLDRLATAGQLQRLYYKLQT